MKPGAGTWIALVAAIIGIAISFIAVGASSGGGIIPLMIFLVFGGFMFLFFFKFLIRPVWNAIRLRKTGLPGTARVVSVKDTGMSINNNPVVKLEVEVKDQFGLRYPATIRALVSRIDPHVYRPGMEVAVLIDPQKKENVIIDDAKKAAGTAEPAPTELERSREEKESILRTGHAARAIIKKYNWLGAYVNGNNPYVELELEVLPEIYPPFLGKTREVIPEAEVHRYQPGAEVKVKYDIYDNDKIVLDPY